MVNLFASKFRKLTLILLSEIEFLLSIDKIIYTEVIYFCSNKVYYSLKISSKIMLHFTLPGLVQGYIVYA